MRVPFRSELDEVFRSDRSTWLKIGGCSLVTIFVVVAGTIKSVRQGSLDIELTTPLIIKLAAISGVLGAILGLALSLKDTVDRRIERGDSVNSILLLYFGQGGLSLVVWFVSVIVLTFFVAVFGSTMKLI